MDYRGPRDSDFDNVCALNKALLARLGDGPRASRWLAPLPAPLARRCRRLGALQRERLARAPFLLMSFRETDAEYWASLLAAGRNRELFAAPAGDEAESRLLAAALGFVWQLSSVNPYAARLLSGATLHWCEQLADQPLVNVLAASTDSGVLGLRRAEDVVLWQRLLVDGTCANRGRREAARISALQRVLTVAPPVTVARAARDLSRPVLGVTENDGR